MLSSFCLFLFCVLLTVLQPTGVSLVKQKKSGFRKQVFFFSLSSFFVVSFQRVQDVVVNWSTPLLRCQAPLDPRTLLLFFFSFFFCTLAYHAYRHMVHVPTSIEKSLSCLFFFLLFFFPHYLSKTTRKEKKKGGGGTEIVNVFDLLFFLRVLFFYFIFWQS